MIGRLKTPLLLSAIAGCASTPRAASIIAPTAADSQVREGRWDIRDTHLFVRDVGSKNAAALVVVHGGPGGNHISQRPLEALSPEYRVVLYDQRGTGESDRLDIAPSQPASLRKLSLEENVEDLEVLRKKIGHERISLIGILGVALWRCSTRPPTRRMSKDSLSTPGAPETAGTS